jgi:hypothetical protein
MPTLHASELVANIQMLRWGSAARALSLFPRRALQLSCRSFSDSAPDAAAAVEPAEAAQGATRSQRQKQAKAEAAAKAAEAKPAPPDFIGESQFILFCFEFIERHDVFFVTSARR